MKISPIIGRQEFASKVLTSESPKLVVFAASWCGYCHRFLELASSSGLEGDLIVVDVDDEDESLWEEFKIPLVPTLVVFRNGKELFRQNGRSGIGLVKGDLERGLAVANSPKKSN